MSKTNFYLGRCILCLYKCVNDVLSMYEYSAEGQHEIPKDYDTFFKISNPLYQYTKS